jgi:uncharacterized membrane protein YeiB
LWGDILSFYAATGAIMFFCRSWRPGALLAGGAALHVVMAASSIPIMAPPSAPRQISAASTGAAVSTEIPCA